MKKHFLLLFVVFYVSLSIVSAQLPANTLVQIVKTEDARRYDATLENLLKNPVAKVRVRAALAAGRIGDEKAVSALANLLKDNSAEVQTMAMFALGEIESAKAADAVLEVLKNQTLPDSLRARAIEAAGKIAAANPKDVKTSELGNAIVAALDNELGKNSSSSFEIILLGETAVLRARPEGGEDLMIKLLSQPNARIRADALNTLARLRSKKANSQSRELLQKDSDPIVRASAARMLGVGEDKSAVDLLLNAANQDTDSRVRVSAIRSLGSFKDTKVSDGILTYAENLLTESKKSKFAKPIEKSELLELAVTLGKLYQNSNSQKATDFLAKLNESDKYQSPEIQIALARIATEKYISEFNAKNDGFQDWRVASAYSQGFGEIAASKNEELKARAGQTLAGYVGSMEYKVKPAYQSQMVKAIPDMIQNIAALKPDNLTEILKNMLTNSDVQIRVAVAGALADQSVTPEIVAVLKTAFIKSLLTDKHENDAQLAILNALYKLDKKESVSSLLLALNAPDYLVRQKAFQLIKEGDFAKDYPGIPSMLASAKTTVQPYAAYTGTKLGQVLNTNADYVRAVSRKNGSVKAILTTTKGSFTIDFYPEDAPLTVDNFIKLARSNYFNGVLVHRVVPNFVMQDGDPRGDGNGGPGWSIRCEINMLPYDRGAIGMALSGKDTGGSQWFATHSPQPHLDGGYTVFGKVNENDMKVVDNIVRGDKILSVKIIERTLPKKKR